MRDEALGDELGRGFRLRPIRFGSVWIRALVFWFIGSSGWGYHGIFVGLERAVMGDG